MLWRNWAEREKAPCEKNNQNPAPHAVTTDNTQPGSLQSPASHFPLASLCLDDQLLKRFLKISHHQILLHNPQVLTVTWWPTARFNNLPSTPYGGKGAELRSRCKASKLGKGSNSFSITTSSTTTRWWAFKEYLHTAPTSNCDAHSIQPRITRLCPRGRQTSSLRLCQLLLSSELPQKALTRRTLAFLHVLFFQTPLSSVYQAHVSGLAIRLETSIFSSEGHSSEFPKKYAWRLHETYDSGYPGGLKGKHCRV